MAAGFLSPQPLPGGLGSVPVTQAGFGSPLFLFGISQARPAGFASLLGFWAGGAGLYTPAVVIPPEAQPGGAAGLAGPIGELTHVRRRKRKRDEDEILELIAVLTDTILRF